MLFQPLLPLPPYDQPGIAKQLLEGASIVVADEAHNVKNPKSNISRAMGLIKTRCRLALTGYPLQNNLDEYYVMINWVRPCYALIGHCRGLS